MMPPALPDLNVPRAAVLVIGPLIGPFNMTYPQIKIDFTEADSAALA